MLKRKNVNFWYHLQLTDLVSADKISGHHFSTSLPGMTLKFSCEYSSQMKSVILSNGRPKTSHMRELVRFSAALFCREILLGRLSTSYHIYQMRFDVCIRNDKYKESTN